MVEDVVIVGAGPSGLAAAHECVNHGAQVEVIERHDQVGGLCRTIPFRNARFDIGPHRFFTKNKEVNDLFRDVLAGDLVVVPRTTRILHDGVFFDYPLTPLNAMLGIGVASGLNIATSYAVARIRGAVAPRLPVTFEDWVTDHFGQALYERFFKAYTEKVWGIPCHQIGADWASQRIRGLSLGAAIRNAVFKPAVSNIKSLVDEFGYPRLGAGQVYEKLSAMISRRGGRVRTGLKVCQICRDGARVRHVVVEDRDGRRFNIAGRQFLTSATLTDTLQMMVPPPPENVLQACRALRYRDHIGVNLLVRGTTFPDNWIYVHSRTVGLARIANYRNFSPEMAGVPGVSPLTVEYFAFPGDELSRASDDALCERAIGELEQLSLLMRDQVIDRFVVRSEDAYPVMELGYDTHVRTIRAWLDNLENLLPIGRSGMFKYNNQDHAIATGLLSARKILGSDHRNPWNVNIDAEYHEAASMTAP